MKFGFVGRAWARYFGRPATSVSPQIGEDAIIDRMIERGLIEPAWVRLEPIPPGTPYVDPRQRGAEPSTAFRDGVMLHTSIGEREIAAKRPGIIPPGLEMPWPKWRQLARELDPPPGWSACRFATWCAGEPSPEHANPEDAGTCAFVLGIVRGDFGIWRSPFPVCHVGDDGMLIEQCEDTLAAVTHLRTGLGMGVFADRDAAIASCTAAEGLGINWRTLDPNNKGEWMRSFSRLRQAREFAGLTVCRTRHAHHGSSDGPPLSIWEQSTDAMSAGRPEKLS